MYVNTIEDVKIRTGLKEPFIRKTILNLQDIFKLYSKRGVNNSILFDENAMQIWDRIKQSKESGLNIEGIRENIGLSTLGKTQQKGSQTLLNQKSNQTFEIALKGFQESFSLVLQAKDETIQTQYLLISELQNKVLLITDGKDPLQLKSEYQNKDIKLALLEKDINQKEEQLILVNSQLKNIEADREREKEIIQKLNTLEGKLFQGRKRKELLQELQQLSLLNSKGGKATIPVKS